MKRQYRAPVDLDTIELWFNGSAGRGVHLHGEIAPSGEIRDRLVERAGHSLPTAHLSGEAAGKAVRQDVAVVAWSDSAHLNDEGLNAYCQNSDNAVFSARRCLVRLYGAGGMRQQ